MNADRLNDAQQQAVKHLGSPLLVLAGAGSGKTRVITRKITWLVQQRAVDPADITAVTFTNKAAREMKQRVGQALADPDALNRLTISTFHSLGMKILRKQAGSVGLRPGFSIIDPRDVTTLMAELLRADSVNNRDLVERVGRRISRWKNQGITVEQTGNVDDDPISRTAAGIYKDYQRYLQACNSVDLDDLILLPVELFRSDPAVLREWQLRIRYLLVDEYQDTNAVQYELVKLLARDGKRLTVVGDDDQSIYAWRGARPQNLSLLERDFPGLSVIMLEQNYRSCGRILTAANQVIAHNPRSFDKKLWSSLGYGDPIRIFTADNDQQEAERVVSSIMRQQFQRQSSFGDFAVLYRSNHQARELEVRLREMRIPYRLSGGASFFDRAEIRDLMAYLRLLTNPDDDSAFLRIVNTPRRGIGATSLEKLAALASEQKQSLCATLSDPRLGIAVKLKQADTLREFASLISDISARADGGDAIDAVREMLSRLGYRQWLRQTCEIEAAERRWENINMMVDWLDNARHQSAAPRTLSDLVGELVLNDALEDQKQEDAHNQVSLMTLHAAKGLEFPHVYIVGVEEDILPHKVSIEEGSDQEERRLFYVGITRAMQSLTLSTAARRKRFGALIDCQPSRFLDELPEQDIEWDKGIAADPARALQAGRDHLASIRALRQR